MIPAARFNGQRFAPTLLGGGLKMDEKKELQPDWNPEPTEEEVEMEYNFLRELEAGFGFSDRENLEETEEERDAREAEEYKRLVQARWD